jgi:hypothetical protein
MPDNQQTIETARIMASDNRTANEKFADELRHAAFPGAVSWDYAGEQTKEAWLRVAVIAGARIEREVDKALREAVASAHEMGQHAAAKMLREMRSVRGF